MSFSPGPRFTSENRVGPSRELEGVDFTFQPIVNLATGAVVGVEVRYRPRSAEFGEVLAGLSDGPHRLTADVQLASSALRWAIKRRSPRPIHINLLAETIAGPPRLLDDLRKAVAQSTVRPVDVVIEIGPLTASSVELDELLAGLYRLRELGHPLLIDQLRTGDVRWPLILALGAVRVKLHADLVGHANDDLGLRALADAATLCAGVGAHVIVDGISTDDQLRAVRALGVPHGQGSLFARSDTRSVRSPARDAMPVLLSGPCTAQSVGTFARAVVTLPVEVTGAQVYDAFRDHPAETSIVLVDRTHRPVATLDRSRFMLAMSGRYGHALHSSRPALQIADPPRALSRDANVSDAVRLFLNDDQLRRNDDIVITDAHGRCAGTLPIADLLRGVVEFARGAAVAQHPVTSLGGLDTLRPELARRLADQGAFAAGWLVPNITSVLARCGFAGAEHVLRLLADSAKVALRGDQTAQVTHVLDGVVVLTSAANISAADQKIRELLGECHDVSLYSAWLRFFPGANPAITEIEKELVSLIARAKQLAIYTAQVSHIGGSDIERRTSLSEIPIRERIQ